MLETDRGQSGRPEPGREDAEVVIAEGTFGVNAALKIAPISVELYEFKRA